MSEADFERHRARLFDSCYNDLTLTSSPIAMTSPTDRKPLFLFLDDDAFRADRVRDPEVYYPLIGADKILALMDGFEVVKAVSVEDAQAIIASRGCPDFISFDNDLQRPLEGIHLAHWLVERDLDQPGFIPKGFDFFVHSQNGIAKARIQSYLGQYLQTRG